MRHKDNSKENTKNNPSMCENSIEWLVLYYVSVTNIT